MTIEDMGDLHLRYLYFCRLARPLSSELIVFGLDLRLIAGEPPITAIIGSTPFAFRVSVAHRPCP